MSKGGAGKVYFVLYLAVILELLIIFIERDEAEEHLRQQQQQAIEIVQTILSQLQTGSGATDMSATPKDQVVLDPQDDAGTIKNYDVKVSVGDPRTMVKHGSTVIKGDDIPRLTYTVSYIANEKLADTMLGQDSIIEGGTKIFQAELGTDVGGYTTPKQIYGTGIPAAATDRYFALNEVKTNEAVAKGERVKIFGVNFKPTQGAGWYRLHFDSETNKILGIAGGGEPSPSDTIHIGNVKLTVKQLREVQKAMAKQRGKGDTTSPVETYINKLLEPGAYKSFKENRSDLAFDVRVTKPPIAPPQQPFAEIIAPDTTYWYKLPGTQAPITMQVKLGPKEASKSPGGLTVLSAANNTYTTTVSSFNEGLTPVTASASNAGMTEKDEVLISAEVPAMRIDPNKWKGLRASVGRKYNPTSEWMSTRIPADHYQTEVFVGDNMVFTKAGNTFKDPELPDALVVTEAMANAKNIRTDVFWKPGGTSDRTKWVKLLTTDPSAPAVIPHDKGLSITFPAPEQLDGFEFTDVISQRKTKWEFGPITLKQQIAKNNAVPVQASVAGCEKCDEYGISYRLQQGSDESQWTLLMEVADSKKLKPSINGQKLDVLIDMVGRGGAEGSGSVSVTLTVGR